MTNVETPIKFLLEPKKNHILYKFCYSTDRVPQQEYIRERCWINFPLWVGHFFFHGFKMDRTMMIAITRSNIMEIIMHFLDFFWRLFAVLRASVPRFTWSTAFLTCKPRDCLLLEFHNKIPSVSPKATKLYAAFDIIVHTTI